MKEFNELIFKDDARYTQTHEWAKKEGNTVRVGVDDFSQSALGDIVYAELPEVGAEVHAGAAFGSLESTKAVSDLNAPVSGKVVKVNEALADSPDLVNKDPFGEGWMIEIEPSNPSEFDKLMAVDAYKEYAKGEHAKH